MLWFSAYIASGKKLEFSDRRCKCLAAFPARVAYVLIFCVQPVHAARGGYTGERCLHCHLWWNTRPSHYHDQQTQKYLKRQSGDYFRAGICILLRLFPRMRIYLSSAGTLNRCERHQWFYSESRKIVSQWVHGLVLVKYSLIAHPFIFLQDKQQSDNETHSVGAECAWNISMTGRKTRRLKGCALRSRTHLFSCSTSSWGKLPEMLDLPRSRSDV